MAAWIDIFRHKTRGQKKVLPPLAEKKSSPLPGTPKVRVVFMGTPALSATLLQALLEAHYNVVGVVTKIDKAVGRKQELVESEVKKVALKYSLPLLQPQKFDTETLQALAAWKPDLIVVAAYGKILPKEVLKIPGFGCVNFHTSLLPRWRGASPIQNALLSGDNETGVTIMLMDEGMDTGDILSQRAVAILPEDTKESLTEKLLMEGKGLLLETLPQWVERKITPKKQDTTQATLCQLIEREDGHVVWTDEAQSIYNRFRALTPWPGIFAFWKKDEESGLLRLKLNSISYQKQDPQSKHVIGEVFEVGEKVGVQTGEGVVFLESVQLEGKTSLPIADFLRGNPSLIGSCLK